MKNPSVRILFFLVLLITIAAVKAEEAEEAEEAWPPGSALHHANIYSSEMHDYEQKTHAIMRLIYASIDDPNINSEIKSQIETWHKYKQAACAVIGTSSGAGGSWPTAYTVRCERGLSYDRYFATKNALQCIRRIEKNKGVSPLEKLHCFIQTFNVKLF